MAKRKRNNSKNNIQNRNIQHQGYDKKSYDFSKVSLVISSIIGVVSTVISIIIASITNNLSSDMNEITMKNSPLNYQISCVAYPESVKYNTTSVEDDILPLTISPYVLKLEKAEASGDFVRAIFANVYADGTVSLFDEYTNKFEEKIISNEEFILYIDEIENDEISFFFSTQTHYSEKPYEMLHLILQAYDGTYHLYTMLYSTENYKCGVFDTVSIHNQYQIQNTISECGIAVEPTIVQKEMLSERKMVLATLME